VRLRARIAGDVRDKLPFGDHRLGLLRLVERPKVGFTDGGAATDLVVDVEKPDWESTDDLAFVRTGLELARAEFDKLGWRVDGCEVSLASTGEWREA
jgi:hypothetical protein